MVQPLYNEKYLYLMSITKDAAIEQVAAEIVSRLGLDTELVQACVPVVLENLVLMNKKQHDYGPHNLTKFGTFGVVVRANDKLERLITLTKPGAVARVNDEGVADTLRDLSNYGMIGYVIEKKLWPVDKSHGDHRSPCRCGKSPGIKVGDTCSFCGGKKLGFDL